MNVQKINYQKEMEKILDELHREGRVPRLLLHSCCAPCSSYVLEYLSEYFDITVFYYNPNIYPESEYEKRIMELYGLTERKAAERIRKTDKERRYYYEVHTGQDWGSIRSHQMLLNVSMLGIDRIVDILAMIYNA